jgi:hypothetical protein
MGLEKEADSLTGPEMEVVTVVFHQFETGLREGTIYTRVSRLRVLRFGCRCYYYLLDIAL